MNAGDFDGFENIEHGNDDPAAEFLAREQSDLAELGDEFGFSNRGNDAHFANGDVNNGPAEAFTNGAPADNTSSDSFAAIRHADIMASEPEKIRIWREEFKARIEEKDSNELKKREEMQAAASKELEDWYRHHNDQLEKTRSNNRAAEDAYVEERDDTAPGAEWERVCRLCEFNPKHSKNVKDVSRMRGIILNLKQQPVGQV